MTIEIDDRLYNDFKQWATANGITEKEMHKYIITAFRDKFNIDKYGDLNDKLIKHTEEPKIEEQNNDSIYTDTVPTVKKTRQRTKVIKSQ